MTYGLEGRCSIQLSYWREAKIGTAGFEPATPRSQSECSTGLSHVPFTFKTNKASGDGGLRQRDLSRIASELPLPRPHVGDINPRVRSTPTRFLMAAARWLS